MDAILMMILMLFFPAGFLLGKWTDMVFRVKMYRKMKKQEHFIMNVVNKDKKTIWKKIVSEKNGFIDLGNKMWLFDKKSIWRATYDGKQVKIENGKKKILKKEVGHKPESEYIILPEHIRWEEGVPNIYVDEDSITPISFYKGEKYPSLTPVNLSNLVKGFIEIDKEKDKNSKTKDMPILSILILLGILAILGLVFLIYTNTEPGAVAAVAGSAISTQAISQEASNGEPLVVDHRRETNE